jgi:hypothetical protein
MDYGKIVKEVCITLAHSLKPSYEREARATSIYPHLFSISISTSTFDTETSKQKVINGNEVKSKEIKVIRVEFGDRDKQYRTFIQNQYVKKTEGSTLATFVHSP